MFARALVLALLVAAPSAAQDAVRTERIQFGRGARVAKVTGVVQGYGSAQYLVGLQAGQTLKVALQTNNLSNYFNITAPGADTAMFVGSTSGASAALTAPKAGDYTIQVYLMRNAARRNESARYTLTVGVPK